MGFGRGVYDVLIFLCGVFFLLIIGYYVVCGIGGIGFSVGFMCSLICVGLGELVLLLYLFLMF